MYIFWRKLVILALEWPFVLFWCIITYFHILVKNVKIQTEIVNRATPTYLNTSTSLSLSLDKKKSKHIHPAALVFTLGFMLILKLKEALYN